jgi:ABC-type bacteriocin/lantibiotic exporter with double-glycine peptidase domain
MNTSGDGTSVAAMVRTAAKHGLRLEGVSLTMKGLAEQKLPIIALVAPGHYVIVEAVSLSPTHPLTSAKVAVWDPDAKGTGAADRRTFSATEWAKAWEGVALR